MKTQAECIEALKNGATLINPQGFTVYLHNGKQIKSNIKRLHKDYSFDSPHLWRIVNDDNYKAIGVSEEASNNIIFKAIDCFVL